MVKLVAENLIVDHLSFPSEDLKWAFSQLRKRCRFIFGKSTKGGFRLARLKVYLANQNIRPIFLFDSNNYF